MIYIVDVGLDLVLIGLCDTRPVPGVVCSLRDVCKLSGETPVDGGALLCVEGYAPETACIPRTVSEPTVAEQECYDRAAFPSFGIGALCRQGYSVADLKLRR